MRPDEALSWGALRLHSLARGQSDKFRCLRELDRTQWLSQDEVAQGTWNRVREVLEIAFEYSPFYRERFASAGIRLTDVDSLERLTEMVPVLEREELRENAQRMVDERVKDARANYSGGSTGMPVTVYQDDRYSAEGAAVRMRHDGWAGWFPGARTAVIWGADRDAPRTWQSAMRMRLVEHQLLLNAFEMSDEQARAFVARLAEWKPVVVRGYATSLARVARVALDAGQVIRAPRGAIATAEVLSEEDRRTIEAGFACRVFNRYGSREVGLIASECPEGRMHVAAEHCLVEVLLSGDILVTSLSNRVMPLIRYRIGDLGELDHEPCSCGRGLPVLKRVVGRVSDTLTFSGGVRVHGEFFTHLFYGKPDIVRFQVRQTAVDRVKVAVVVRGDVDLEELRTTVESHLRAITSVCVSVEMERVHDIPVTPSGKHRVVIGLAADREHEDD